MPQQLTRGFHCRENTHASLISTKRTATFFIAQTPLIILTQIFNCFFFLTPVKTANNVYYEINKKFYLPSHLLQTWGLHFHGGSAGGQAPGGEVTSPHS